MKQQQKFLGASAARYPCSPWWATANPYSSSTGPQDLRQVSGPTVGTVGAAQTPKSPNSYMYVPTKATDAKARLILVVEEFIVGSDILQVLASLVIVRFNPQFCAVASRDFSSYSLVSQPLWLTLDLSPTSACGLPSGVCRDVCPRIEGAKVELEACCSILTGWDGGNKWLGYSCQLRWMGKRWWLKGRCSLMLEKNKAATSGLTSLALVGAPPSA